MILILSIAPLGLLADAKLGKFLQNYHQPRENNVNVSVNVFGETKFCLNVSVLNDF